MSFKNNVLILFVNFPRIGDQFEFTKFQHLEVPKRVGLLNDKGTLNTFLLPYQLPVEEAFNSTGIIRSFEYCKTHKSFIACPGGCSHGSILGT